LRGERFDGHDYLREALRAARRFWSSSTNRRVPAGRWGTRR
jgi:UDP-N-acetylmuramyl pentapeptide synthase